MTGEYVWNDMAGQALLWAFLLVEIPKQTAARNAVVSAALEARIVELEEHFPSDEEIPVLSRKLAAAMFTVENETVDGPGPSPVAAIVRRIQDFPRHEARVEFGMGRDGNIAIRCLNTAAKLPACVRSPRQVKEAKERAASLVRGAMVALG